MPSTSVGKGSEESAFAGSAGVAEGWEDASSEEVSAGVSGSAAGAAAPPCFSARAAARISSTDIFDGSIRLGVADADSA